MSSVSGYDSLEAVNMPMPQESQRRSVDQDKEWSNLSFANPHYMGPDLESLVYKNGEDLHTRYKGSNHLKNSPKLQINAESFLRQLF